MTETAASREDTARRRILDFLKRVDRLEEPGAVLGGDDLPETTVFECVAQTWPDREVVHLDSTFSPKVDEIRGEIVRSFQPGRVLLMTITRRAGKDFFRFLEQLLVDGHVEVPDGQGWMMVRPPERWRFVIHSRPGRFPTDEAVNSKISV